MLRKIIIVAVASSLIMTQAAHSSDEYSSGVVEYIQTTIYPEALKVKAEYLVHSISRIFSEDWRNKKDTFLSISDDISISLSCYIHESGKTGFDKELNLVDEIQTLMTSSPRRKGLYEGFMNADMQREHSMKDESICSALI
ncbi:hypothetical protein QTV49_001833 [Vibrio vulnificus]|nr:hypothetical protein [Vibrio vulnificus]